MDENDHNNPNNNIQEVGGSSNGKNNYNTNSRQSSSRWTPTTEQIRILKELYYNNGVRSPTADQIQRISAKLRQYGKIEGKNVFYWFQNHKARERQKKRFTTDHFIPMQQHTNNINVNVNNNIIRPNVGIMNNNHGVPAAPNINYNNFSNKMNNPAGNFASSSASSARGVLGVGNYGYGSVAMEQSFRECSITPSSVNAGGSMGQKFAWIGVDQQYPCPNFVDQNRKYTFNNNYGTNNLDHHHHHQTLQINDQDHEEQDPEIETLPLFPMHGDQDHFKQQASTHHDHYNINGWQRSDDPRASLELTLNSYSSYAATSFQYPSSTPFDIFK